MYLLFGILVIVASVLLTLAVVVQNHKGGGLSSAFGASNISAMIGARRAAQDIEKMTWYLVAGVFVFSILASAFSGTSAAGVQNSKVLRGKENLGNLGGTQTQMIQDATPAAGQGGPAMENTPAGQTPAEDGK